MEPSLADFEAAVLCAINPAQAGPERAQGATAFLQGLSLRPDAPTVALRLLCATSQPAARFFALQALEHFIVSPAYGAAGGGGARRELRRALLGYASARGAALCEDPP